jgi:hypothetical protein
MTAEGTVGAPTCSLTKYQHLKALQIIHMYLNGLQRSYDVTTDHAWCACGVPVVHMTCLWCPWWCLWAFRIDFLSFSHFIDNVSSFFVSPSNHSCASEWPSKVVFCHYRSCMLCLWCACGAYDVPVMPVVVPVGFLDWFFSFSHFIDDISTFKSLSNNLYASKRSKVVWCLYRLWMVCLWCACGEYDVPVMPVVVPVGFLDWLFFVFPFYWLHISI